MTMNSYVGGGDDFTSPLFETPGQPSLRRPLPFSPFPSAKIRRFARPTQLSRIPRATNIGAAIIGAELQGLPILRQGEEIAAVLEATRADGRPTYGQVTVLIPRRAAKTTSIWNIILGRCSTRDGYRVVTTAQDGVRARNRFRDVQRALERAGFETHPGNRLRWANGDESIEFGNGSRVWVVPPDQGAFRGEAADLMLFDEAGELSPTRSDDLVAGALPLMDTRPYGQVVIAGTPGDARAGLLWDGVQSGINLKSKRAGVIAYHIRDDEQSLIPDDDGNMNLNTKVLRRVHPGIGTLTDLATMRERFERMPLAKFEAEYMCRFPFDALTGAIAAADWAACKAGDSLPARPDRTAWAYDVEPDGSTAALMAAWRDDDGRPHLELVRVDAGAAWLAAAAKQVTRKHRGAPIGCDNVGANSDAAARLEAVGVRLQLLGMRHTIGASARLASEIHDHTLRQHEQPLLDDAVAGAVWRTVGDSGRLFGRRASASSVAPLVAGAVALWLWDVQYGRQREKIVIQRVGGDA